MISKYVNKEHNFSCWIDYSNHSSALNVPFLQIVFNLMPTTLPNISVYNYSLCCARKWFPMPYK
jgi:hypothetical protein